MSDQAVQGQVELDWARVRRPVGWVGIFLLVGLVVWLRRPDALTAPQFWAEDGRDWYASAYNSGPLHALFEPYAGYLSLLPRAVGGLVASTSLSTAATLMAIVAIGIQALTTCYVLRQRFAEAVGSRWAGVAIALAYLLLPNSDEVASNLTNSQWHVGFLGMVVLVSGRPRGRLDAAADVGIVGLMALTGPFALLALLPYGAFVWLRRHDEGSAHRKLLLGLVLAGCAVQVVYILTGERRGSTDDLTPIIVAVLYGKQVVLGGLFGKETVDLAIGRGGDVAVAIAAAALLAYTLLRATPAVRSLAAFGVLAFLVALPSTTGGAAGWQQLELPGIGQRYFMLPALGLYVAIGWAAFGAPTALVRWAARALLVVAVFGAVSDFKHAPYPPIDYGPYEARIKTAFEGQVVEIPVYPGFTMRIDGRCVPGDGRTDCSR